MIDVTTAIIVTAAISRGSRRVASLRAIRPQLFLPFFPLKQKLVPTLLAIKVKTKPPPSPGAIANAVDKADHVKILNPKPSLRDSK